MATRTRLLCWLSALVLLLPGTVPLVHTPPESRHAAHGEAEPERAPGKSAHPECPVCFVVKQAAAFLAPAAPALRAWRRLPAAPEGKSHAVRRRRIRACFASRAPPLR